MGPFPTPISVTIVHHGQSGGTAPRFDRPAHQGDVPRRWTPPCSTGNVVSSADIQTFVSTTTRGMMKPSNVITRGRDLCLDLVAQDITRQAMPHALQEIAQPHRPVTRFGGMAPEIRLDRSRMWSATLRSELVARTLRVRS